MALLECGVKNSENCPANSTEALCIERIEKTCNYNRNIRFCGHCTDREKCDYCADLCSPYRRIRDTITD